MLKILNQDSKQWHHCREWRDSSIVRVEFSPLVRIGANRGHYWPEETTDEGPARINAGACAFLPLIINRWYIEILYCINTVLCLIKVNSNTIELKVHTSFYCVFDLLCVINGKHEILTRKGKIHFFSPTKIWITVPWNWKHVRYQSAMLTLFSNTLLIIKAISMCNCIFC